MAEPILLEKPIRLYDATGKAIRSYQLELDGEIRKEHGTVLRGNATIFDNHFRGLNDGTSLLTLPEVYAAIEQMQETKHPALEKLLEDISKYGLLLGTQFDYQPDTTIITHYVGEDPLKVEVVIPKGGGYMKKLIQDSSWRNAIQGMLLCEDVEKAVDVLSIASGKKPYLVVPSQESRESRLKYPVRTAWLGCYSGGFNLDTNNDLDSSDAARGVRRGASVSEL